MSNSISTLLLRNLSEVFAENDPARRRAAIDEIFHEDAVFYDPKGGIFRGRDEIDRIAGVIKATHPDPLCALRASSWVLSVLKFLSSSTLQPSTLRRGRERHRRRHPLLSALLKCKGRLLVKSPPLLEVSRY